MSPDPQNYEYMNCRAIGHSWRVTHWGKAKDSPYPLPNAPLFGRNWSTVRIMDCSTCENRKVEFFMTGTRDPSESWRVVARRYFPPKGYRFPGLTRRDANKYLYMGWEMSNER